jgi:hypothetical protein
MLKKSILLRLLFCFTLLVTSSLLFAHKRYTGIKHSNSHRKHHKHYSTNSHKGKHHRKTHTVKHYGRHKK